MDAIKIYSTYFIRFLKARLEYRGDFFAGMAANVLTALSGLLFVLFLVDGERVPTLAGWTRAEVLFIYGYSMLPMAIFMMVAPNLYQFGDKYIIQGQFDRVLLRPLSAVCQVLFESFNLESVGSALTGIGVIIYAAQQLEHTWTAFDFIWLIASALSGGILLTGVFVTVASMSFFFEDRLGISAPVFNLATFGRYPVTIFNRTIQIILTWIVPFAFVAFYPTTHFLDREGFRLYCYGAPLAALAVCFIASIAWRSGVARYSSTGN